MSDTIPTDLAALSLQARKLAANAFIKEGRMAMRAARKLQAERTAIETIAALRAMLEDADVGHIPTPELCDPDVRARPPRSSSLVLARNALALVTGDAK